METVTTRGTSADGRYECYYCLGDRKAVPAVVTIHDARGCLHVCWDHAEWRNRTSMIGGHSDDCPHRAMEPLVAEAWAATMLVQPRAGHTCVVLGPCAGGCRR